MNLFAFRSKSPRNLAKVAAEGGDPVGWQNQEIVSAAAVDAGLIVCAWGAHGGFIDQDETMLGWLHNLPLFCLGTTAQNHPRHPLYVPYDTPLQRIER